MRYAPLTVFRTINQLGLTQVALFGLYRLGLMTGYYKRVGCNPPVVTRLKSLFSLPGRDELRKVLGRQGQEELIRAADEIVAGRVRLFGGQPVELELSGNWPPAHWTEYERGRIPLDRDLKFVWEPARFGWAFILGRAFHLTGEERYAEAFWESFESFAEANPPNLGPHWMSGQEVALRLMALVWADQVFETAAASSPERRARLAESVAAHAVRIPPTLLYARAQNNNHLVTEAAALYTAGLALAQPRWRALGWRWLNRAFRRQISGYGEYIQHSANYHRLMLQTALWVHAIRDRDWPRLTFQALGRATHWLFSMLDSASGRTPNLGANDGALVLPLAATPFGDFRPTVQAGARAFLRFQLPSGPWDELSLWLGLNPHERAYEPELYLTDHLRGRDSWAYLRASTFPSRLGHMDQLHLDLWWRGLNVARDPGTYLYNAAPPWDNPLVASRVHNTVTVDDKDQMTRGGRFMTLDWFPAYSESILNTDESVLGQVRAHHSGYPGVWHERLVTVLDDESWLVQDELIARRARTFRLHWLIPDWEWELEASQGGIVLTQNSPLGKVRIALRTVPQSDKVSRGVSLVRAGEVEYGSREVRPFEGWISPTYGEKVPALSLAYELPPAKRVRFETEFRFDL